MSLAVCVRSPSVRQNSMWVVVDKLPLHNFHNLRSVCTIAPYVTCQKAVVSVALVNTLVVFALG